MHNKVVKGIKIRILKIVFSVMEEIDNKNFDKQILKCEGEITKIIFQDLTIFI